MSNPFYTFPDDDDTWEDEPPEPQPFQPLPGGGQLSAIETWYRGVRFRSRTEARHALFFDGIGVPWQHEEQPYGIDGQGFLPDFRMPDRELDVEVKRDNFDPNEPTQRLFFSYAANLERVLFLVRGYPTVALPDVNLWYGTVYLPFDFDDRELKAVWAECSACGHVGVIAGKPGTFDRGVWDATSHCRCRQPKAVLIGPKINKAVTACKSFDWEHSR